MAKNSKGRKLKRPKVRSPKNHKPELTRHHCIDHRHLHYAQHKAEIKTRADQAENIKGDIWVEMLTYHSRFRAFRLTALIVRHFDFSVFEFRPFDL